MDKEKFDYLKKLIICVIWPVCIATITIVILTVSFNENGF